MPPGATPPEPVPTDDPPHLHVAVAADHRYAMPLGVAVSSAVRALDPGAALTLHVLDGGLTATDRARIERVVERAGRPVDVDWVAVDPTPFKGLKTSWRLSHVQYFRLLVPDIAPPGVRRVLYLDADVVVRHDLSRLWAEPLHGAAVGAVRDPVSTVSGYCGLRDIHDGLGLPADTPYFNSGVLLIDLDEWRRQDLSAQALAFVRDYRDHVIYADQDSLNAVVGGAWHELDPRWNVQGGALDDIREGLARPAGGPGIVHFTSPAKPWRPWGHTPPAGRAYFDAALRASGWFRPAHRVAWTAGIRLRTLAKLARGLGGRVLRRLGLRRDRAQPIPG